MHNFINTQTAPAAAAVPAPPPPLPPPPPAVPPFYSISIQLSFGSRLLYPAICDSLVSCNSDPDADADADPDLMLTRRLSLPPGLDWIMVMAAEVSACLARSLCHNLFVNGAASWPSKPRHASHQHTTPASPSSHLSSCPPSCLAVCIATGHSQ